MTILQILVATVGVVMSLAHFPQAYRIYKTKSAKDISLLTYSLFAFGMAVYTIYAISLGDFALIASFVLGVVGSWLVLILKLIYK